MLTGCNFSLFTCRLEARLKVWGHGLSPMRFIQICRCRVLLCPGREFTSDLCPGRELTSTLNPIQILHTGFCGNAHALHEVVYAWLRYDTVVAIRVLILLKRKLEKTTPNRVHLHLLVPLNKGTPI